MSADRASSATPAPEPRTVLVVEDDPHVLSATADALRVDGFEVLEARDAAEVAAHLERRTRPIHALVADLLLPTATGFEVAERLRRAWPHLRVLFVTGHGEDVVDAHRVASVGAGVLAKPYGSRELTRRVRECLAALDSAGAADGRAR